jgi:MFS family permease
MFNQYAAVMGMNEDLKLVGNNFTNAATALYISTLVGEIISGTPTFYATVSARITGDPLGYILQKVPVGKWLGMNVILWGIVTASIASVKNYHGLLVCRVLLGVFEAATSPCLMLIIGEPHDIPIIMK